MATERKGRHPHLEAQGGVLKRWRQERGLNQQDLGRQAGYGSDESAKSAAVAISRIESGKTDPGQRLESILWALGHTEDELRAETAIAEANGAKRSVALRALAGTQFVDNEGRRARIIEEAQRLNQDVEFQMKKLGWTLQRVDEEFVVPFLKTASWIDWGRDLDEVQPLNAAPRSADDAIRDLQSRTEASVRFELARSTASGIAGAGLGAGAAAGVFAAVSATATASTGTAIASLSGAAASSATMAWLGGGSLAAGGLGVAGGTMVLTGIVALPAMLAMGGVLVWKGRQLRRLAQEESARLDVAEEALAQLRSALPRALDWSDRQQDAVGRAGLIGRGLHARHSTIGIRPSLGSSPYSMSEMPPRIQTLLETELKLVVLILNLRALPVWLEVTSVGEEGPEAPAKTARVSSEWIERSLEMAGHDLDRYQLELETELERGN